MTTPAAPPTAAPVGAPARAAGSTAYRGPSAPAVRRGLGALGWIGLAAAAVCALAVIGQSLLSIAGAAGMLGQVAAYASLIMALQMTGNVISIVCGLVAIGCGAAALRSREPQRRLLAGLALGAGAFTVLRTVAVLASWMLAP